MISRYSSVFTAIVTTQLVGLAGTLILLAASTEPLPATSSLAYAAVASVAGVAGLGFFYHALSRGTMGVVAPLAALIGAGLPVLLAVLNGEQVPAVRWAGIAIALGAVVLISLPGGERTSAERRRLRVDLGELPLVVLSGLGFAGFFIFVDRATAAGETWWPMTVVRGVGSMLVLGATAVAILRADGQSFRERAVHVLGLRRMHGRSVAGLGLIGVFVVAGVADLGGNVFFLLAKHAGAFSVAVVLSSLYPIVTAVIARFVLNERLRPLQVLGVALAAVSIPLLR